MRLASRANSYSITKFKTTLNSIRSRALLKKVSRKDSPSGSITPRANAGRGLSQGAASLEVAERHLSTEGASREWAIQHALTGVSLQPRGRTLVENAQNTFIGSDPETAVTVWEVMSPDERLAIFLTPNYWDGSCSKWGTTRLGTYLLLCDYKEICGKDPWPKVRTNLGFTKYFIQWRWDSRHGSYAACESGRCGCKRTKASAFTDFISKCNIGMAPHLQERFYK
jgi:hypothetical protein